MKAEEFLNKANEPLYQNDNGDWMYNEGQVIKLMQTYHQEKVKGLIDYIENDAEISIPMNKLFNERGENISKKKYGLVLIEYLVKELRNRFT